LLVLLLVILIILEGFYTFRTAHNSAADNSI